MGDPNRLPNMLHTSIREFVRLGLTAAAIRGVVMASVMAHRIVLLSCGAWP